METNEIPGPHIVKADQSVLGFALQAASREIMRFEPNGDIYIRGKLIENDRDVVEGMRRFLKGEPFDALPADAKENRIITVSQDAYAILQEAIGNMEGEATESQAIECMHDLIAMLIAQNARLKTQLSEGTKCESV